MKDEVKKEVKEIMRYWDNVTKLNTSKDEYVRNLEKYDLGDILEAHSIVSKRNKKVVKL